MIHKSCNKYAAVVIPCQFIQKNAKIKHTILDFDEASMFIKTVLLIKKFHF